jgi:cytochrome c
MHCLPSKAGFALSPVPLSTWVAMGLGAFLGNAHAQSQDVVARGLGIYTAKCSACHSVDENRVGPAHAGVLGRRAGKAKEFEYSEALAKSKLVWSRANLERWLTDPEKVIPGQRMGFSLSLPKERADVVAYLATLSAPK